MMTARDTGRLGSRARPVAAAVLAAGLGACETTLSPPEPDASDVREVSEAAVDVLDSGERLVGTWRLARVERYDQTGAPLSDLMHPTIGLAPTLGLAMFDGARMSLVMQEDAAASGTDGGPAPDDALSAVERYTSHFGPYAVNEAQGIVSQQLIGSLNPRLTGIRLELSYEFEADQLVLVPGLRCPDSYVTDRGCAYGTTGIQVRNVWERLPPSAAAGADARQFLGFWEIDRIERRTPDGAEVPTDQFAEGYLAYMPSGYMAVHLMRPGRRLYEGPRPTALEAHAALGSYASYFGPFSVNAEEGIVVHHRAGHLDPGSIGVDAPRAFEFRDGQLILRPPVSTVDGQEVGTSVFWNRLSTLDFDAEQG